MVSNFVQFEAFGRGRFGSTLIDDYKEAHEEMLEAIAAMDQLTSDPAPNSFRLSHTRLRITRASMECRRGFKKIANMVSKDAAPGVTRAIEALEGRHFELKELTALHLSTWTPSEIQSNWAGYCRSSEDVRLRWREMIERERQLLYPLL